MPYPYIIAGSILLVLMPLYLHSKGRWPMALQLALKAASTLLCVSVALGYCLGTGFSQTDATLILAGLVLCVLGDVMLEIHFQTGGILFFIGHLCYIVAFGLRGLTPWSLPALILCGVVVTLVYRRFRARMPANLRILVAGYGVILCVLGAAALPQAFTLSSAKTVLGALGAALFIASDLTLCHNLLSKLGVKHQYYSLGMYYMGQLLIALSAVS